jgi:threonine synthase
MTRFVSTRGSEPVGFAEALELGLAPDGGLFVPMDLPRLDAGDLPGGSHGFPASARWGAGRLLAGCLAPEILDGVVARALDFPAPLVEVEPGRYVLELFHGPSAAFKDVGARFMAHALAALRSPGAPPRTVLVATSGDTGGAVAAAFHRVSGYRVVVLFPERGVSERQRRQMTTLGGNVTAVAVDGSFDDCQRLAKGAFADGAVREACGLTSANSINVGRLLPQALYYVHAAVQLGWDGPAPVFVVPCGNLGNLCAGLLAHRSGMPAAGFVAATNVNRTFMDYLEGRPPRTVAARPTVSNAMDVADPSNLERIRWLYGDDRRRLREHVSAASVDDDATLKCIEEVHRRTGYVLDPHGAVAWAAMERARDDLPRSGTDPATRPWVVLATAHPWKFPDVVEAATGASVDPPPGIATRSGTDERVHHIQAHHQALKDLLLEGHHL